MGTYDFSDDQTLGMYEYLAEYHYLFSPSSIVKAGLTTDVSADGPGNDNISDLTPGIYNAITVGAWSSFTISYDTTLNYYKLQFPTQYIFPNVTTKPLWMIVYWSSGEIIRMFEFRATDMTAQYVSGKDLVVDVDSNGHYAIPRGMIVASDLSLTLDEDASEAYTNWYSGNTIKLALFNLGTSTILETYAPATYPNASDMTGDAVAISNALSTKGYFESSASQHLDCDDPITFASGDYTFTDVLIYDETDDLPIAFYHYTTAQVISGVLEFDTGSIPAFRLYWG